MSGERRGVAPALLRALFSTAEPFYSGIVSLRNHRFDQGKGVRRLPHPVISVGNITAGGTGKTPVVRWLCENLRSAGRHPAVLLRGYKSAGGISDEQRMLQHYLGGHQPIPVRANPDRFEGGSQVLTDHTDVDVFVLDDGFQHRRLHRDFDLVLIDAAKPFGFGHVHPRGLLREPLIGLQRASAMLITRSDEVGPAALAEIYRRVREHSSAPIYHAVHAHTGFRSSESTSAAAPDHPPEALSQKRVFAFCALGNPHSFIRQLQASAAEVAGSRFFSDHHAYTAADLQTVVDEAHAQKAEVLITTEKDWTKLAHLALKTTLPIWRAELTIGFRPGDEAPLFHQLVCAANQH